MSSTGFARLMVDTKREHMAASLEQEPVDKIIEAVEGGKRF